MKSHWQSVTDIASNNVRNCVLVFWLLLAVGAAALLLWERNREAMAQDAAARTMTALVAAHMGDVFKIAELALEDVSRTLEEQLVSRNDPVLRGRMQRRTQVAPFLRAIFVIGPDGFITQDTDYPETPAVSLADRSYFRQYLALDGAPRALSGPYQSRSGKGWFMVLTRRVGEPENMLGVAAAAFQLAYFESLHQRLQLPIGTAIFLFQEDGVLLAQHPSQDAVVGNAYRSMPLFVHHLPASDAGSFRASGPPLNYERRVAYERITGYGLVVGLAQRLDDSLAAWQRTVALVALGMLLLLAALLYSARQYERAVAERARVRERLHRSEKMEALGQLTGGIAHDFGNLLGILQTNLELLRRMESPDPRAAQAVARASRAVENGSQLVQQLLSFSRKRELATEPTELNGMLASLHPLLQQAAGNCRVLLNPCAEPAVSLIDPHQLEVALINLVINARDAMDRPGEIVLRTRLQVGPANGVHQFEQTFVCLSVEDNGRGMSPEVQARAMEPFFTTKGEGGTGLGLSQVFMLVTQCGGDMSVESLQGKGTRILLLLPALAEKAAGLIREKNQARVGRQPAPTQANDVTRP